MSVTTIRAVCARRGLNATFMHRPGVDNAAASGRHILQSVGDTATIRAQMASDDPASRVGKRAPEPAANPCRVLASQILSGLDGIARGLVPPPPSDTPYDGDAPRLRASLLEAIARFDVSAFHRGTPGDACVDHPVHPRRAEWDRDHAAVSDWEQAECFSPHQCASSCPRDAGRPVEVGTG